MSENNTKCPHCGGIVTVQFRANIVNLSEAAGQPDWEEALSDHEAELLAKARGAGVLAAFEDAVPRINKSATPKNLARFLLTFLARAQPTPIERDDLDLLVRGLSIKGRLTVYQFNSIGAVVEGDTVRAFIPMVGKSARSVTGLRAAMDANLHLERWVRVRYGYVPAGLEAFSMAMRQRSVGDFARLVQ